MLLLIHIAGALGMFGLGVIAVFGALTNRINNPRFIMRIFAGGFVFEAVTGIFLAISQSASLGSTCIKLGLYLVFFVVVELVLLLQPKRAWKFL